VVVEECGGSGPCLTAGTESSLELARLNRRVVDEVCVAVLRTLPSHAHLVSSQSFLSPSERLAYKARIPHSWSLSIIIAVLLGSQSSVNPENLNK